MKPSIFIAIPNLGNIATDNAMNLLAWFASGRYGLKVFAPQNVRPWDRARNLCHRQFLSERYEYLFFLDANTIPHPSVLDRLLRHDLPMVAGVVQIWQEHLMPMSFRWDGLAKHFEDPASVDEVIGAGYKPHHGEGLQEVDVTTCACTLIKREVMERVRRPAFAFTHTDEFGTEGLSEDFYFCDGVRLAGYPIAVDFDAVCDHDIHARSLAVNRDLVSVNER